MFFQILFYFSPFFPSALIRHLRQVFFLLNLLCWSISVSLDYCLSTVSCVNGWRLFISVGTTVCVCVVASACAGGAVCDIHRLCLCAQGWAWLYFWFKTSWRAQAENGKCLFFLLLFRFRLFSSSMSWSFRCRWMFSSLTGRGHDAKGAGIFQVQDRVLLFFFQTTHQVTACLTDCIEGFGWFLFDVSHYNI